MNHPSRPAARPYRIFFVDDDPDDRLLIAQAFHAVPAIALRVFSGAPELLAALRLDAAARPDMIVLDINMPGMCGVTALREIRADPALAGAPVTMLSTSDDPDTIRLCYERGANAYLVKPASVAELDALSEAFVAFWVDAARSPTDASTVAPPLARAVSGR